MEKGITPHEIEAHWTFYDVLDCVEALEVQADCNDLEARPKGANKPDAPDQGSDSVGMRVTYPGS